jgi:voltage-gated potassium channel
VRQLNPLLHHGSAPDVLAEDEAGATSPIRHRIYQIIEVAHNHDSASRYFDIFMMALITTNVLVVMLETVQGLHEHYLAAFALFDTISVAIFTVEYILRIWVITVSAAYRRPVVGRIRYALTPLAIIDLVAIIPFYLPMVFPFDLRFVRSLRLMRIFRLLKMSRYSEAVRSLERVFLHKKEELLATFFVLTLLLIFASSLMYYAEHEAQPEEFASIPAALWWGVVTLATVGYGDVYPITTFGKIIGGFVVMISIGIFALPAGIFASGFAEELERKKAELRVQNKETCCPHCGKKL